MNNRIILFFYVDDIITLYYPDYQKDFEKLEQQLVKLYGLYQMGNIKWYLGILVERLLTSRQLCVANELFGDDVKTFRLSAGCIFILYGMPIDWKATILCSVTRSIAKAELYAFSAAGVESQYWDRFCHNIGFMLHSKKAL
jgi:hypothetical protein